MEKLSGQEREALRNALREAQTITGTARRNRMTDALLNMVEATARATGKRQSDRMTDSARRMLVGARIPRQMAEDCRQAAQASGRSLYRFVLDALAHEAHRNP